MRADRWVGLVVVFLCGTLFIFTMCPTVYLGDAGELIVGAVRLGIAHPPGYPLYCILGKFLCAAFPFGSWAFRVNLLSALSATGACAITFALTKWTLSSASRPVALAGASIAALSLAASRVFWSQATVQEVYAVMMGLFAAWLWGCTQLEAKRTLNLFCVAGLLYGIGFTHHPTFWLMGPLMVGFLLWRSWRDWRHPVPLSLLMMCSLLGLALYLYFPIRSFANPVIDWGNPETYNRVFRHVMRKQYRAVSGGIRDIPFFMQQLNMFWIYLKEQMGLLPFVLGMIGWGLSWRRSRWVAVATMSIFLLLGIGIILLLNYQPTYHQKELVGVFWLPVILFLAIWVGQSAAVLDLVSLKPSVKIAAAVCLAVVLPVIPLRAHFHENNQHQNTIAYHSAWDMLMAFPQHAILFTAGDFTAFPLAYLTMTEGVRPDVWMFDDYGSLFPNPYGDDFLTLPGPTQGTTRKAAQKIALDDGRRPVYTTLGAEMSNWAPRLVPEGINYRVHPEHTKWSPATFHIRSATLGLWEKFNMFDTPTRNILNQYEFAVGEHFFMTQRPDRGVWHYKRAAVGEREYEWLSNNLATMLPRRGQFEESAWFYQRVLEVNPWYAQAYVGLGNIALNKKRYAEAEEYFRQAAVVEPYSANAWYLLGNAYSDQKKHNEAMEAYKKALAYDPYNASAHKNLAYSLMEIGQKDAAYNETKIAAQLSPTDYQLWYNKGAIELAMKRYDLAEQSWRRAYELNPKDPRLLQSIQMLMQQRQAAPPR